MFGFRNFHGRIVCKIRKANDIRQPWHLKMKGSHHEADESLSRGGVEPKLEHTHRTAITVRWGVQLVWEECHKRVRKAAQATSEKY